MSSIDLKQISSFGNQTGLNQNILLTGALLGFHTYGINKYMYVITGIVLIAFIINGFLLVQRFRSKLNNKQPNATKSNLDDQENKATTPSNTLPSNTLSNPFSDKTVKIHIIIQIILFILFIIIGMYYNFKRVEYINKLLAGKT